LEISIDVIRAIRFVSDLEGMAMRMKNWPAVQIGKL